MYILIDENNAVVSWVECGGIAETTENVNVVEVDNIPDEVKAADSGFYCYTVEKGFYENPDYQPPEPPPPETTTEELALAVTELAETQASDKIEIEMAMAELAEMITGGV